MLTALRSRAWFLAFALAGCRFASGQQQQFADLGECKLDNGQAIQNCRLGYRTFGKLNRKGTNAILWPTWFTGTTEQLVPFIGKGKWIDPEKYFVVLADALGNGVSSAPSNSKTQARMQFPQFTIRDMVRAEYRLLTEKLNVKRLHAVMGVSMGGMQTFEWMVTYSDFMDRAIPIVGSPRLGTSDVLLWSAEAEAIRNDREWNEGNYSSQPKLLAVQYMHKYALETPVYYNRTIKPADAKQALANAAADSGKFDANDWLRQLEAMLSHNVYRERSMADTAKLVKAKVTVIEATQDHMVSPEQALAFADAVGANKVLLTGDCGHLATTCESPKIADAIRVALR